MTEPTELVEQVARAIKNQIVMDMMSAREAARAIIPIICAHDAARVRSLSALQGSIAAT